MLESHEMEQLKADHKINVKIWIALMVSLPLYVVVALNAPEKARDTINAESLKIITGVLLGLCPVYLAAAFFIKRFKLKVEKPLAIDAPEALKKALANYRIAIVICLALSEAVALLGLVLFFMGASESTFLVFMMMGAVAMAYFRPSYPELETYAVAQLDLLIEAGDAP